MDNPNDTKLVPLAIIAAGLIIAGAIYFGGGRETNNTNSANRQPTTNNTSIVVAPITDKDHIVGSKNAEIVIIEYSDFDCPFCKVFHKTMYQIVDNYGGKVAWVYRHFPINSLHPNASKKSEASECVAEMGGNTAFWKFVDKLLGDETITLEQTGAIVTNIGLDINTFNTCLNSGKFTNQIQADVAAATKAGAQGTPYSVIITKSSLTVTQKNAINALEISSQRGVTLIGNNKIVLNGAQPFETIKNTIDVLLK